MRSATTSGLRAILVGGLVAGTIDIGAAALINHVSPVLIAHYIATGVMGPAALSAGPPAAMATISEPDAAACVVADCCVDATELPNASTASTTK